MLQHSQSSNPMITGSSVHNQRIERLWCDVFRVILSVFYQVFRHLQNIGTLDPLNEVDLYCMHQVYMPRINYGLHQFSSGWNNHALTTECSMTLVQLFSTGSLQRRVVPNLPQSLQFDVEPDTVESG